MKQRDWFHLGGRSEGVTGRRSLHGTASSGTGDDPPQTFSPLIAEYLIRRRRSRCRWRCGGITRPRPRCCGSIGRSFNNGMAVGFHLWKNRRKIPCGRGKFPPPERQHCQSGALFAKMCHFKRAFSWPFEDHMRKIP